MLAETRSGPYYVAVVSEAEEMEFVGRCLMARNWVRGQDENPLIPLAVWYEECENEAAALVRAAEIRCLPQHWRRGLIESINPQWVDLGGIVSGVPLSRTLPEREGLPYYQISQL